MKQKIIRKKGITLLETVLYLALFSIIFGIVMQIYFSNQDFQRRSALSNDIERSFNFANGHISTNISDASSISTIQSVFESTLGSLTIIIGGQDFVYDIYDGDLVFFDGDNIFYITSPILNVDQFYIEQVIDNGVTVGVRIQMTVSHENDSSISRSFENTFLI